LAYFQHQKQDAMVKKDNFNEIKYYLSHEKPWCLTTKFIIKSSLEVDKLEKSTGLALEKINPGVQGHYAPHAAATTEPNN
jgi:hypothetical protein